MRALHSKLAIQINEKVYKKDPLTSELGEKILREGIDMIESIGFENFTFRKLAKNINSTEASIYRYFESKHYLLTYLTMWYWNWMEYRVVMATLNIKNPKTQLRNAVKCLTEEIEEDLEVHQIDEAKLQRIVIIESSKIYQCKSVDADNEAGFFKVYKQLVHRVAEIILKINPKYKYPHMLVSTIIEGVHHQRFFANHLPRLTDIIEDEDAVTSFYKQLIERELKF
ncbi:MAG: AcrR family transcriptional regulator [Glaciecola sp.]|jgi:AcrR family transcriptional regulator